MGFYVSIYITFHLCLQTGKPFYYSKNYEKIFDLSTLDEIPIEFRRFLFEQGNGIFPNYMRDDHYYDSAEMVYNAFPSWEDVEQSLNDESKKYWKKEDHDLFYKAIKWFATSKKASFTIQWG